MARPARVVTGRLVAATATLWIAGGAIAPSLPASPGALGSPRPVGSPATSPAGSRDARVSSLPTWQHAPSTEGAT